MIYSQTVNSVNIKGRMSTVLQDVKAAAGVLEVFTTRLIAHDGPVVDQASAWCEMIGCPFFQLSPPIFEVDSCEGDTAKIVEMMFSGPIYINHIDEKIRRITERLIKHRNQKLGVANNHIHTYHQCMEMYHLAIFSQTMHLRNCFLHYFSDTPSIAVIGKMVCKALIGVVS